MIFIFQTTNAKKTQVKSTERVLYSGYEFKSDSSREENCSLKKTCLKRAEIYVREGTGRDINGGGFVNLTARECDTFFAEKWPIYNGWGSKVYTEKKIS